MASGMDLAEASSGGGVEAYLSSRVWGLRVQGLGLKAITWVLSLFSSRVLIVKLKQTHEALLAMVVPWIGVLHSTDPCTKTSRLDQKWDAQRGPNFRNYAFRGRVYGVCFHFVSEKLNPKIIESPDPKPLNPKALKP